MAETTSPWAPRSAWAGIAEAGFVGVPGGPGIVVEPRSGFGLAALMAPPGGAAALSAFIEGRLGLALPSSPRFVAGADHDAIWSGPDQWLLRSRSRAGLAPLMLDLEPLAAVSEQSDARAALRLRGARTRDVLAKGVMLDLHPSAFPVGQAALTSVSHMGVHLWRCADGPDGPVFEIMVARSMARSFWSWLVASAAEYGCDVRPESRAA